MSLFLEKCDTEMEIPLSDSLSLSLSITEEGIKDGRNGRSSMVFLCSSDVFMIFSVLTNVIFVPQLYISPQL